MIPIPTWSCLVPLVCLGSFVVLAECGTGTGSADPDVRQLENFLTDLLGDDSKDVSSPEPRTFGHKRIQFMLMPMMYKMGVMMTMLTVLTVISLKGLLVGAILLILKLSTVIAKFSSGWHQQPAQSWQSSPQPIHVHVHNSLPYLGQHHQPYSAWMSASGPEENDHIYYKG